MKGLQIDLVDIDEEISEEGDREDREQAAAAGDPLVGAELTWHSAMRRFLQVRMAQDSIEGPIREHERRPSNATEPESYRDEWMTRSKFRRRLSLLEGKRTWNPRANPFSSTITEKVKVGRVDLLRAFGYGITTDKFSLERGRKVLFDLALMLDVHPFHLDVQAQAAARRSQHLLGLKVPIDDDCAIDLLYIQQSPTTSADSAQISEDPPKQDRNYVVAIPSLSQRQKMHQTNETPMGSLPNSTRPPLNVLSERLRQRNILACIILPSTEESFQSLSRSTLRPED